MALADAEATKIWKALKSQLEDRSVLELGSVDDATMTELEAEQLATIKKGLVAYAQQITPYSHQPA